VWRRKSLPGGRKFRSICGSSRAATSFRAAISFVVAPGKNRPGVIFIAALSDEEHLSASFLNRGLRKLARYCIKHKVESVALPKIDAGLDWEEEVKPLIEKFLEGEQTEFYIYED
jgi:hypothetical protein